MLRWLKRSVKKMNEFAIASAKAMEFNEVDYYFEQIKGLKSEIEELRFEVEKLRTRALQCQTENTDS